jgi:hypothetical protein
MASSGGGGVAPETPITCGFCGVVSASRDASMKHSRKFHPEEHKKAKQQRSEEKKRSREERRNRQILCTIGGCNSWISRRSMLAHNDSEHAHLWQRLHFPVPSIYTHMRQRAEVPCPTCSKVIKYKQHWKKHVAHCTGIGNRVSLKTDEEKEAGVPARSKRRTRAELYQDPSIQWKCDECQAGWRKKAAHTRHVQLKHAPPPVRKYLRNGILVDDDWPKGDSLADDLRREELTQMIVDIAKDVPS